MKFTPSVASCQYAVDDLYTTDKTQPENWTKMKWTLDVAAEAAWSWAWKNY